MEALISTLASTITGFIDQTSYIGISLLMVLESANIPIPSEIVMPFSGFLVSRGDLNFWLVSLAGAVGCTIGSIFSYWLGSISEKTWIKGFVSGWGRILISQKELASGENWLRQYGLIITFISRLLPVVRTFISFPAGVARVNLTKFIILSFTGSFIWSTLLTYVGYKLGQNWDSLRPLFRQFDYLIVLAIIIMVGWLIYHRGRHFAHTKED